jgi:hypothetical protein
MISITPIRTIVTRVETWARTNVPNEYMYNSRMTYFNSAFRAGIITKDELEDAKIYYANLWDYVGD